MRTQHALRSWRLSAVDALALAIVVCVLLAQPWSEALEYRRALLASEVWRAFSGHFVHVNAIHAAINSVALLLLARLFAPELSVPRLLSCLIIGAFAISAALAFAWPAIAWYRGLSGVLHCLYFAAATHWLIASDRTLPALALPALLIAGGWIKVLAEQPWTDATPYADWLGAHVVPQAHLAGALAGTLLGLLWSASDSYHRRERQHPKRGER